MMLRVVLASLLLVSACKKKPTEAASTPGATVPSDVQAAPPAERPDHIDELVANFEKVFFDTDSSEIDIASRKVLERNAAILQEHMDVRVQVQGHADERGTVDYNLQLGNERADAVKDYLVNQGVGSDRVTVISFGEEIPASSGHHESSWSQNRRAEFVVQWGS
jgi:peptidoglycan-associated lipoprotein